MGAAQQCSLLWGGYPGVSSLRFLLQQCQCREPGQSAGCCSSQRSHGMRSLGQAQERVLAGTAAPQALPVYLRFEPQPGGLAAPSTEARNPRQRQFQWGSHPESRRGHRQSAGRSWPHASVLRLASGSGSSPAAAGRGCTTMGVWVSSASAWICASRSSGLTYL